MYGRSAPTVEIRVTGGAGPIKFTGVVDTGATANIVTSEFVALLWEAGVDITPTLEDRVIITKDDQVSSRGCRISSLKIGSCKEDEVDLTEVPEDLFQSWLARMDYDFEVPRDDIKVIIGSKTLEDSGTWSLISKCLDEQYFRSHENP